MTSPSLISPRDYFLERNQENKQAGVMYKVIKKESLCIK